jgi:hypothetical protein
MTYENEKNAASHCREPQRSTDEQDQLDAALGQSSELPQEAHNGLYRTQVTSGSQHTSNDLTEQPL